jgi:colicin import membrane protein
MRGSAAGGRAATRGRNSGLVAKSLIEAGCATVAGVKRRYPLEALRELRQKTLEDGARELGARSRARAAAEGARVQARKQREVAEHAAELERRAEREELEAGRLNAADLAQGAAWEEAERARLRNLREVETRRAQELDASQNQEATARRALGERHDEAKALDRHRRSFDEQRRRDAEAVEAEAAADAFGARRGRS